MKTNNYEIYTVKVTKLVGEYKLTDEGIEIKTVMVNGKTYAVINNVLHKERTETTTVRGIYEFYFTPVKRKTEDARTAEYVLVEDGKTATIEEVINNIKVDEASRRTIIRECNRLTTVQREELFNLFNVSTSYELANLIKNGGLDMDKEYEIKRLCGKEGVRLDKRTKAYKDVENVVEDKYNSKYNNRLVQDLYDRIKDLETSQAVVEFRNGVENILNTPIKGINTSDLLSIDVGEQPKKRRWQLWEIRQILSHTNHSAVCDVILVANLAAHSNSSLVLDMLNATVSSMWMTEMCGELDEITRTAHKARKKVDNV